MTRLRAVHGIFLPIVLAIAIVTIVLILATIPQTLRLAPAASWASSTLVLLNTAAYFVGNTQFLYLVPLIIFQQQ